MRPLTIMGEHMVEFSLQPTDPRLLDLHHGGPAPSPPLENLVGARQAWQDVPQWMDFLDPSSELHARKIAERDLYRRHWQPWWPTAGRVLDLGGGIGRFSLPLLQAGCTVELVDPDLRSLWRAAKHAGEMPLKIHWATGECLPDIAPVDAILAAEVLCYTEDPALTLRNLRKLLKPGGVLLFSVEARWGWGLTHDVAPDSLDQWLDTGIVHIPGDRWVRTFDEENIRALFADWQLPLLTRTHYLSSGPFEGAAPEDPKRWMELEDRLRTHPIAQHLHRAWTGVAV